MGIENGPANPRTLSKASVRLSKALLPLFWGPTTRGVFRGAFLGLLEATFKSRFWAISLLP